MEDNKELVEETTENVEAQTTEEMEEAEETDTEEVEDTDDAEENEEEETLEEVEEPVEEEKAEKKYSDDELDEIIKRKLSRYKKKIEREYNKKYSRLENVLYKGLDTDNVEDATNKLTEFYEENGVNIPDTPRYSDDEIELIAEAEANRFIKDSTYKELVDEIEDIESAGELTDREKLYYQRLKEEKERQEEESAVLALGISKSELEKEEFLNFSKKLNPDLPIKEKYELYLSTKPKKINKQIGSMKTGVKSKTKDFYTAKEIARLTDKELDDDETWEAVRRSMTKDNGVNTF